MENGAFWLQGQIWCEHSQTSDGGMAGTDVPSIILVSIFCRFFFSGELDSHWAASDREQHSCCPALTGLAFVKEKHIPDLQKDKAAALGSVQFHSRNYYDNYIVTLISQTLHGSNLFMKGLLQFCTPRVGWQPCYWLVSANNANDNNRRVCLAFV